MDKAAKELIQKLAGSPGRLRVDMAHAAYKEMGIPLHGKPRQSVLDEHSKKFNVPSAPPAGFGKDPNRPPKKYLGPPGTDPRENRKKESSMRNIIDDLIKGAQQNTFGRPVSIQQGFDPSPLDLAKTAGMLQLLGERGYSVKQAAEYLGLTQERVQYIVDMVR